jgi:hypothetical protein
MSCHVHCFFVAYVILRPTYLWYEVVSDNYYGQDNYEE